MGDPGNGEGNDDIVSYLRCYGGTSESSVLFLSHVSPFLKFCWI